MTLEIENIGSYSASVLKDSVMNAFGRRTAEYIFSVALLDDFEIFKMELINLGYDAYQEEKRPATRDMPRVANAIISMRYPFMIPRNAWTGEIIDDDLYDWTELNSVPTGWRRRFGLEMCEDIRVILKSSASCDPMQSYRIDQIKEKYGSLRWYDGGYPNDVAKLMSDVNTLYESLSECCCVVCGSYKDVRVTSGWIVPECFECLRSDIIKNERHLEWFEESAGVAANRIHSVPYALREEMAGLLAYATTRDGLLQPLAGNVIVKHGIGANALEENLWDSVESNPLAGKLQVLRVINERDQQSHGVQPFDQNAYSTRLKQIIEELKQKTE